MTCFIGSKKKSERERGREEKKRGREGERERGREGERERGRERKGKRERNGPKMADDMFHWKYTRGESR